MEDYFTLMSESTGNLGHALCSNKTTNFFDNEEPVPSTLLKTGYTVWAIVIMTMYFPVAAIVAFRLYRELTKDYVIDMFKVLQYLFLFLLYAGSAVNQLLILIDGGKNIVLYLAIFNFPTAHVFFFQITNHLCWTVMIVHCNAPGAITETDEYRKVRRRIILLEILFIMFDAVIYVFVIGVIIFIIVLQGMYECTQPGEYKEDEHGRRTLDLCIVDSHICRISDSFGDIIMNISRSVVCAIIVVFQVILMVFLLRVMKKRLHYRYVQQKRIIIISSIMTIIYFTLLGIPFSRHAIYYNVFFNIVRWVNLSFGVSNDLNNITFIVYILADIALNIFLIVFSLFNTKNIEFKIYLKDLLYGRRIIGGEHNETKSAIDVYMNSSIFVVKSCCKTRYFRRTSNPIGTSSLNSSIDGDSLVTVSLDSANREMKNDNR